MLAVGASNEIKHASEHLLLTFVLLPAIHVPHEPLGISEIDYTNCGTKIPQTITIFKGQLLLFN